MSYLPPDILKLIYAYVGRDFVRWITQCALHGDLKQFMLLLQPPFKPQKIRELGLFKASLRNPNSEIANYFVQAYIERGHAISRSESFIAAIKHNKIEIANRLQFPCKVEIRRALLRGLLETETDGWMRYCFTRDPTFRDFCLLGDDNHKTYKKWSNFIVVSHSVFVLDMLLETGAFKHVFEYVLLDRRVQIELFVKLWTWQFGNEFDAHNPRHTSIFGAQLVAKNYDCLTFMARLPCFRLPRDSEHSFALHCNSNVFVDWLLTEPILYASLLSNSMFWKPVFFILPFGDGQKRLMFRLLDAMPDNKQRLVLLQHEFVFAEHTNLFVYLSHLKQWDFMLTFMNRYNFASFGTPEQCDLVLTKAVYAHPLVFANIYKYVQPKISRYTFKHVAIAITMCMYNLLFICFWLLVQVLKLCMKLRHIYKRVC